MKKRICVILMYVIFKFSQTVSTVYNTMFPMENNTLLENVDTCVFNGLRGIKEKPFRAVPKRSITLNFEFLYLFDLLLKMYVMIFFFFLV